MVDDEAILLDEALSNSALVRRYYRGNRPGSYFAQGSSGGGWGSGAALGAKLAEPERDVVTVAGDGFYGFGVPAAALWSAVHYGAPYLAVVFVNARFSTGTDRLAQYYPGGHGMEAGSRAGASTRPRTSRPRHGPRGRTASTSTIRPRSSTRCGAASPRRAKGRPRSWRYGSDESLSVTCRPWSTASAERRPDEQSRCGFPSPD